MKIAITSEPKLLPLLHAAVRWQAREHGFSEADAEGLALAIGEAAGKIIHSTHAAGLPEMMLSLEMVAHPDRLELVLEDSGPKVNATAVPAPASRGVPRGGSESPVQSGVDAGGYDSSCRAGNRLKLVKFLPGGSVGKE